MGRPRSIKSPSSELLAAAREGDAMAIRDLLRSGADPNSKDKNGETALAFTIDACCEDEDSFETFLDATSALLDGGASPNEVAWNGVVSVCYDEVNGATLLGLLLAHGLKPNRHDHYGSTLLHSASTPEIAGLLLSYGATIDARNDEGATPLLSAVLGLRVGVAAFLIESGADRNARDKLGRGPFHTLCLTAKGDDCEPMIHTLFEHKVDCPISGGPVPARFPFPSLERGLVYELTSFIENLAAHSTPLEPYPSTLRWVLSSPLACARIQELIAERPAIDEDDETRCLIRDERLSLLKDRIWDRRKAVVCAFAMRKKAIKAAYAARAAVANTGSAESASLGVEKR